MILFRLCGLYDLMRVKLNSCFRRKFQYFLFCRFSPQASMLTSPDGPFINLSRLNLAKYAQKPKLAKVCT